jgi:hypothetical protein
MVTRAGSCEQPFLSAPYSHVTEFFVVQSRLQALQRVLIIQTEHSNARLALRHITARTHRFARTERPLVGSV